MREIVPSGRAKFIFVGPDVTDARLAPACVSCRKGELAWKASAIAVRSRIPLAQHRIYSILLEGR
jgi:hypothetical protein